MSLSLVTITTSSAGAFGFSRERADDVVGFEARLANDRNAKRFAQARDVRNLQASDRRASWFESLCRIHNLSCRNVRSGESKATPR